MVWVAYICSASIQGAKKLARIFGFVPGYGKPENQRVWEGVSWMKYQCAEASFASLVFAAPAEN